MRFKRLIGEPDANGCWQWLGNKKKPRGKADGYGTFCLKLARNRYAKAALAHRVSFVLFRGAIPAGMTLDHLCRNRACVNPAHLEPVTHKANCLRGESPWARNAIKTMCPKGHPLAGGNLKFDKRPNGGIARRCRICANAAVARHWKNLSAAKQKQILAKKAAYKRSVRAAQKRNKRP